MRSAPRVPPSGHPHRTPGRRLLAIAALATTPLALGAILPEDGARVLEALRAACSSLTPRAGLDALCWIGVWCAAREAIPSAGLRALPGLPVLVFAIASLGTLSGALALAALLFGQGLAARRTAAPGRPQVLAGFAGGALVALGPLGAGVATLALAMANLTGRHATGRDERRAEALVTGFVPAVVAAGLLFTGWAHTGADAVTLVLASWRAPDALLSTSPWLAAFGGGAAVSWPILLGTAVITSPPVLLALARNPMAEPARVAALLLTANVLAACLLTAANILTDPLALVALAVAADLVALRALTPRMRTPAMATAGLGLALALACLAPLAPVTTPERLRAVTWHVAPRLDEPPAWGVAPSARARFARLIGDPPDEGH